MKSITIYDIPEDKYNELLEYLKVLHVSIIENKAGEYSITAEHKKVLEESLQHYLKNPKDVEDFDQAINDIENGL